MSEPIVYSVRRAPELAERAIEYFQLRWASEQSMQVYADCISHSLLAEGNLPQWYLLMDNGEICGGAGLIPNDFISRMDLLPWLCALYIEEERRGNEYGKMLIDTVKADAKAFGFTALYLCSDHVGYYERYGFSDIGVGYHPWGESSHIFRAEI